jgi:3-deoxy-D-manno-octulosonate 8-phosphate phosphatase (KDO 8-P phosphatase)
MDAEKIKLFAFDVDGTLTPGFLVFGPEKEEYKLFNSQDGLMLHRAHTMGYKVGFITGRKSKGVEARARELGLDFLIQGSRDKVAALESKLKEYGLTWEEAAYMGDDLNDLELFTRVGVSGCPSDASNDNRSMADFVSHREGGHGAAREFMEEIIKRQGRWEEALEPYLSRK